MPTPRHAAPKQLDRKGELTLRQQVADRMQRRFTAAPISWKFGHASFTTADEKVFGFITGKGALAIKLPAERRETLFAAGEAEPMRMGQRTLREWVVLPEPESAASLRLLYEAKEFVESLPVTARTRPAKKRSNKKA